MSTEYYSASGQPGAHSSGTSTTMRSEFANVEAGFAKLPPLSGNGNELVVINAGGTGLESKTAAEAVASLGLMAASTFPNVNATVTASDEQLNFVTGVTSAIQTQINSANASANAAAAAANAAQSTANLACVKSNNLSDVANTATARGNIGAAASGANADITSLASPALANATANTQSAGDSSTKVATTAFFSDALLGLVGYFPSSTAPGGWLKADGSVVSQSAYANLFNKLGSMFNTGAEGAGNFRLPDLRSEFIRGLDNSRSVGSWQEATIIGASGSVGTFANGNSIRGISGGEDTGAPTQSFSSYSTVGSDTFSSFRTHPRNVALLACIKY